MTTGRVGVAAFAPGNGVVSVSVCVTCYLGTICDECVDVDGASGKSEDDDSGEGEDRVEGGHCD